jgi:hypothetical protein
MTEQNWVESMRRIESGDITEDDAARLGSTHAAYGWACKPYLNWSENLTRAYRKGWGKND